MRKKSLLDNRIIAALGALLCAALWGTAFPLIKLGYSQLEIAPGDVGSKLLFAGERFTLAGVMVLLFGLIFYRKPLLPGKRDLMPVALLGIVQTTLQYLFAYVGVGMTTATNTSILTGTVSIISVIAAGVLFRSDRLTALKIVGCVVGLTGIAVVNIADFSLNPAYLAGDGVVLLSAFCGAGGNIITKKVTPGRNPTTVTSWQLISGGIILLIVGLLAGGRTDFNAAGAVTLLWLSLVSSVSFLLWTALLQRHPVSRITVFSMLIPIFGAVWSAVLLGEEIFRLENLVSLVLISAGILLVNINFKDKRDEN